MERDMLQHLWELTDLDILNYKLEGGGEQVKVDGRYNCTWCHLVLTCTVSVLGGCGVFVGP